MGNANLKTPPTPGQIKGLHWARVAAGIPGIIGSVVMIQHILRSKRRRSRTISRVILAMGIHDFIFALFSAFGSTLNPEGVLPDWVNPYARGTWATCEMQGFFLQFSSTASVLYNGALALCYLLTLRYQWKDEALKKIEPVLHVFPHMVAISMSSVSLAKDLYNPTPAECRIQEYPQGCLVSGDCIRGDNAENFSFGLFFSWVWAVFFFLCVSMTLIYRSISATEHRTMQYTRRVSTTDERQSLRVRFAMQAMFYCIVYFMTWIWGTINSTLHESALVPHSYMPIIFLLVISEPLQGFWNAVVYFRPRYLSYRRQRAMEASTLDSSKGRCCSCHNKTFQGLQYTFRLGEDGEVNPNDISRAPSRFTRRSTRSGQSSQSQDNPLVGEKQDEESCDVDAASRELEAAPVNE